MDILDCSTLKDQSITFLHKVAKHSISNTASHCSRHYLQQQRSDSLKSQKAHSVRLITVSVPQSQYMVYSDANILSEHVNSSTTLQCTKMVLRFQPQCKQKTNMTNPNNGDNSYTLAPSHSICFVLRILLVVYLITLLAAQTIQQQTNKGKIKPDASGITS